MAGVATGRLPLLTYPQTSLDPKYPQPSLDLDFGALGVEDSECDTLPFDLDSDLSPGRGGGFSTASHGYGLDASESDVAVGAFVRLIEHAPPLQSGSCRSSVLSKSRPPGSAAVSAGSPGPCEAEAPAGAAYASSRISLAAGLSQLAKLRAQIE